ncbi:hypothetical protein CC1G_03952 [Coprinopsis cinerea okayama7|uniref:Peptide hydrolase n=1 Tax=Coprinopsis cinerea (strain Okayama-7 / 130 / ATCC MYA-4618 / FGSC 9003) TaxID=240176 RepID=A8N8A5_COPC7|nr:hypothetical protein CC1G_03952 [Coprinopsis cinerea okayama7\|eukprot:XP_001831061.2 hypothetical protein CC1G_03952 [Coprinopsis cinerea okayama7\
MELMKCVLKCRVDPSTGLPQISEANILRVAKYLSEDIGYRTVGTKEHALGDAWMLQQAEDFKEHCDEIALTTGRELECEVWRQVGDGSHRFDMMGKRLYKTYANLSNIIVRISDGTNEGKEHALLVNAHLDSTLPSPGAADDAISVGVMLDCMRVLVDTPNWSPKHAVIFLFNNAEESLQDGSHLYATQHPTAKTARAVINLEAAGTTGRELLFQATSEEMIDAYSHVPRPYGTVFANDIFSSGIILSDTDFRQFEEYMDITGLDMAIVGNSYLYHMRKDLVENISPGVAQHMGENTLALIKYLTSSDSSPLAKLANGYSKPHTVYLGYLGRIFIKYSFTVAKILYASVFLAALAYARMSYTELNSPPPPISASASTTTTTTTPKKPSKPKSALKSPSKKESFWSVQSQGFIAVGTAVAATILSPNLLALLMKHVLNRGLSWFTSPFAPLALYGPAALLGALSSQYLSIDTVSEHTIWTSLILMQTFLALVIQLLNVGSAAIFFINAVPVFFALLVVNPLFKRGGRERGEVSMVTYVVGSVFPLLTGSLLAIPTLEVFVPLTGRMGADAPSDNLIATLVALLGAPALPLLLPLSHRFGKTALTRGVLVCSILVVASVAVFVRREPFDEMHQKRLFVIHMENHLHLAAADGAPGLPELVSRIVDEFGVSTASSSSTNHNTTTDQNNTSQANDNAVPAPSAIAVTMNDHNSDWDSLYPFSQFLTPYKVPLPVAKEYNSPWLGGKKEFKISAVDDTTDFVHGTRSLSVKIEHPGLIWTAIAFDAHVLSWSLDQNPPNEFARHHVKEASFYGTDVYELQLTIRLTPQNPGGRLKINFMGLREDAVWPGKRREWVLRRRALEEEEAGGQGEEGKKKDGLGNDNAPMELFERMDRWLEETTGGTVDALLMGCIGGVIVI